MNKQIKDDLAVLPDMIDDLEQAFPKLKVEEQVDVAARINAIRLKCEAICEVAKSSFKLRCKGKDGVVTGYNFNAVVNYHDVTRLDQTKVKVDYNNVYNKCLTTNPEGRVDFKAR